VQVACLSVVADRVGEKQQRAGAAGMEIRSA